MENLLFIVEVGGKQYLVSKGDELVVDNLKEKEGVKVDLNVLLKFDPEGKNFELGKPYLKDPIKAEVVENGLGKKIEILRFKAKVRYRKRKGFRPKLTKIKILG